MPPRNLEEVRLNLELTVARSGGLPLADDYVAGAPGARAFFEGAWDDPESYVAKAREVAARFDRDARERAARAMFSPGEPQRLRLERWVEDGGYVVTTGQQPGLFTGPLYSVYKALTAARLAEALEELLDAPVLPLFWIASEDHDWEESNHTWVVGIDNELRRIGVEAPPEALGRALHRIHPGASMEAAVRSLLAELPETDFSAPFRALLEGAYAPGHTLPEAFRMTMAALLGTFGVYLVDAADPVVKAASRPLLLAELDRAEHHEALLAARARDLEAAGYAPQVPILAGGVNLFAEGPSGRERVYRGDGGDFQLRHSGERLSRADLVARIERDPAAVSPNVLLRPVVESWVFPTVSLVTGPGETSYAAQLVPLFDAHGLRPPVIHPRLGATVLESKVAKVLGKFDVDVPALRRPFHELAADIAREELPPEARLALGEIRRSIAAGSAALTEATRGIHGTLEGPIQRARNASFEAWADAEKKILQALKRENESRLQQLEKARVHVFPEGKPQERVINVFYYLFRYGGAFLDAVWEGFEVRLGTPAPRP